MNPQTHPHSLGLPTTLAQRYRRAVLRSLARHQIQTASQLGNVIRPYDPRWPDVLRSLLAEGAIQRQRKGTGYIYRLRAHAGEA